MHHSDAEELARARLAYVSAGRPALGAPRRAVAEPESHPEPGPGPGPGAVAALPEPEPGAVAVPAAPASERPPPRLTAKHLLVVAVLLLCGVGVAVAALSRSAATELPVQPPVVTQVAPAPAPSTEPPAALLRVHVAGAVQEPGVVRLPEGTIVQDAILAAGGLADDADPATLNLAAPLTDGMQIIIGTIGEPQGEVVGAEPSGGQASGGSGLVNLNSANQTELESLPGVGPVMAQAIIAWRDENGNFTAVEELQEISGVGPKTFEKLAPLVTV